MMPAGLTKTIATLSRQGSFWKALEVYEALPAAGLVPDTPIANAALSASNRGASHFAIPRRSYCTNSLAVPGQVDQRVNIMELLLLLTLNLRRRLLARQIASVAPKASIRMTPAWLLPAEQPVFRSSRRRAVAGGAAHLLQHGAHGAPPRRHHLLLDHQRAREGQPGGQSSGGAHADVHSELLHDPFRPRRPRIRR